MRKKTISFFLTIAISAAMACSTFASEGGVSGIVPEGAILDSDIPDSLKNFKYDIYNGQVILHKATNDAILIYVDSSYNIKGIDYKTNIDDFMIGIGNHSVESVVFSYGIERVYGPVFNSCNVKKVYFPITLKEISDNTLSYLKPDDGEKIKIYYEGSQADWMNIFKAYEATPVSEAEFGEELGTAVADWVNDKIGSGYNPDDFEYFFNAIPENLVYDTVPEGSMDTGTTVEPAAQTESVQTPTENQISNPYVKCDVQQSDFVVGDVMYNQYEENGEFKYDAIVPIINTSDHNLYLKDCKFDIEDANGHLLGTDNTVYNCPSVIEPGETGYFYNPFSGVDVVSEFTPDLKYLRISPIVKKATGKRVRYDVSDTSLGVDTWGGRSVIGRVTNNTDKDDSLCYVNAVYFDENGAVIGVVGTNVSDLYVGVPVSFDISGIYLQEAARECPNPSFIVIAEPTYYQFD